MLVFPNAKINIGLNVTEKRPDGFHNIETIFYPIGISDILEINRTERNSRFINTGLTIENGNFENNICYKAYELLKKDFKLPPINIHLHKIIPFGAGLGGGSSDGTFTLKLLNDLFNLKLSDNKLLKYAEKLGSDCPFFVINQPTYATEKGNQLKPIRFSLKGYYLVLVHPGIEVNTAQAYSQIKPGKPNTNLLNLIEQPIDKWKSNIKNDFEDTVFKNHPAIGEIKEKLYQNGAIFASMSGSGSSVYGIFKTETDLKKLFRNYFVWQEKL